MAAPMLEFRTRGYNPYAVKYSPYYDSRVAVASAANFGIVGNGRLFALGLTAAGIQVEKTYRTPSSHLSIFLHTVNMLTLHFQALTQTMHYTI